MNRVLHVEDDTDHCLMLDNILTSQGFAVETASNGLEGVENAGEWKPDVILLDLLLPHVGGFGVINFLRENPATQDIPIIVVSAWRTADNRKRVREAGAPGFIAKPFQTKALVKAIRESLPQAEELNSG